MKSPQFFVTGTDTSVGKTTVSALLCAALHASYWKPIQTGSREGTDRRTVMRLAGLSASRAFPETYCFAPPVSPHLAAARAGVRIRLASIRLPAVPRGETLIVEGAGGALVPINCSQLTTDLMKQLALPVLLVSRTTLGTINHTLLSLAALRAARLAVRGVILVGNANRANHEAIEHYGRVRVLGRLPLLRALNRNALLAAFRRHFSARDFRA
ncbi:MAG TPA: dethiobiotin synthase [Candidatus Acidoferrales bacterium]|nr:dethiobiotin synthase [Candidatus Acidoferrales bacterium]